ncbi:hypothetical protein [Demequina rhizosphaerae]|uniref:hypothetical protein n=1 Tax=Demequina rhizosphaerae TaxID=1638985 RepID=UPI000A9BF960|nr:hypothetical protein [Demequina rhizosphaerae]
MDLTRKMTIALADGETVLHEGPANLQRGIENVGGRLFLTDSRLRFAAHAVNVQSGALDMPLAEIDGAEVGMTRVFGVVPLAANAVVVRTSAGKEHRFTVQRRAEWKAAIDSALATR